MKDGVKEGEPGERRVEREGRIKGQAEWKVNYWKGEEGDTSVQLLFFVGSVYTYSPHPRLNDIPIYSPHPRTERYPHILVPS